MPELPEVQTIVSYLDSVLKGKTIKDIRLYREKNILTGAKEFLESLPGESFLSVSRRAKYLIFHLTNSKVIVSHLRMEGKYFLDEKTEEPKKHDLLIYDFSDGTSLRYNDVRKFGTIELWNEDNYLSSKSLSSLGEEPFSFDKDDFFKKLQLRKKKHIKEALLDQTLIVGIGNIYASEILFSSKVNPRTTCSEISKEQSDLILEETKRILKEAIKQGGSTIKSYHPREGVSGNMQNELQVYGKENQECPVCSTPIRRIFMGGRSTFYCPHCQKRDGYGLIVGVTGPIASGKSTITSYLSNKGYIVLDADKFAHDSYNDVNVKKTLKKEFPEVFISKEVDRKKLLSIVSENKEKMQLLNSIIHPYVYKKTQEGIDKNEGKNIVIDMPLLLNSPFLDACDIIVGVNAPLEERKKRLEERGVNVEKSLKLNSSFPLKELKKEASIYIETTGSIESTREKLDKYLIFND